MYTHKKTYTVWQLTPACHRISLFLALLCLFAISCHTAPIATSGQTAQKTDPAPTAQQPQSEAKTDFCWQGTIAGNTPVFLHYQLQDSLIVGEIVYLNTKAKTPIQIIGTLTADQSYRILEFEPDGNITGIITGSPKGATFNGNWFSPKSRKELAMQLRKADTVVHLANIQAKPAERYGKYHYQYSKAGYQGDLTLSKVDEKRVAFELFSVTSAPARNIANVEPDTIAWKGNGFSYEIPDSNNCAFKVNCYKGFVYIAYTHGECDGQFGHNATLAGIYLKVK